MAHIIIDGPKNRFIVEWEDGKITASQIKKTDSSELANLLRANEWEVISALFIADYETRSANEVADYLGVNPNVVRSTVFHIRKGRTVTMEKFNLLKRHYGIEGLLK